MTIDALIEDGNALSGLINENSFGIKYLSGEEYEKWVAKSMFFMETNYQNSSVTERFLAAAKSSGQNSISKYQTMLGILKALKEME